MIEKLRPADTSMPPKGTQVTVTLQIETMLLNAHVTHVKPMSQFSDGQTLAPLEEINNRKPLAPPNLRDKSLHRGH